MSVVLSLRVSGDKRKPSTKQFSGKEESIGHIIRKLRKKCIIIVALVEF